MRPMTKNGDNRQDQQMQANLAELAERIARAVPHDGKVESLPGVFLYRVSIPHQPVYAVLEPSFCVIAQGSKDLLIGDKRFHYDPFHYLISTMGLPATGQVVQASRAVPYLALRLVLDPLVATSLMVESAAVVPPRGERGAVNGVDVNLLDGDLLDATLRLVRLTERPAEHCILAPLVIREIIFRLLTGPQRDRMRYLATFGGQAHRIVRTVEKLRHDFNKPLRVEDAAREVGMSVSGFHAHFKAVTTMSPLQFQKHLRLQEARRLMLNENLDAGEAGYRVGYDDHSHFSRDYKRLFGMPPMRDVERMRALTTT
jgi:AraC-like DNA-binding protein